MPNLKKNQKLHRKNSRFILKKFIKINKKLIKNHTEKFKQIALFDSKIQIHKTNTLLKLIYTCNSIFFVLEVGLLNMIW